MTRRPGVLPRLPSATVALGVASCFILAAVALGLMPDPAARAKSDTATWQLRGTLAPEEMTPWQDPRLAWYGEPARAGRHCKRA